jgi:hypothetical protein
MISATAEPVKLFGLGRFWRVVTSLLTILAVDGCIVVPTPPHGGYGIITSESVHFLEPGKTTRAEVLLRFGNPNLFADPVFFAYRWQRTHAIAGTIGGSGEIKRNHYLALEFTPDNRVKRFKLIEPWLVHSPEILLKEWIMESAAAASQE